MLITETGEHDDVASFEVWRDYFAPLLIDAAAARPDVVLAEIANLGGDAESGMMAAKDDDPPVYLNPYHFSRERVEAFFGARLRDALSLLAGYAGDNAHVVRAQKEARAWLKELSSDPGYRPPLTSPPPHDA